ncbi:MAG TPA: zinc-dependent alcohol dehydrogenase [Polyangiaceae bacterium]|nr:zinc-dependent alcohol dehydrogenase [Polyangiaceae bacterium]
MLAVTYRGAGRIRVEQRAEPELEHPNDVILRVSRAAICGSDLHLLHGFVPDTRVGCVFGHEFTGVVVDKGSSVQTLEIGDRVVVPFNIACGTCFFCTRGLTGNCENSNPNCSIASGVYGYSHTTGGYDGGQAEFVRVPFADVGPLKIPDDMTDEQVLFLSDILPTGYQAAEMGDIKQGETVVVFGCGPVGLLAQKCAWLLGAGRVIAVDAVDYRLEFAREENHAETIDFREVKDVVSRIKKLTDGRGADVCIDAVGCEAKGSLPQTLIGVRAKLMAGSATAINWCIASVRKGGNVAIVGVYGPPFNAIDIGTAMNKGLTLRMNQANCRRYMPHLLEHIRAGRLDAESVITHRMGLEHAADAYRIFDEKRDGCIKCVLVPPLAA